MTTPTGEVIPCQNCTDRTQREIKRDGCRVCGGYGIIATQNACDCGRLAWLRPGAHTVYQGKRFFSMDGLEFVYTQGKVLCHHCEKIYGRPGI